MKIEKGETSVRSLHLWKSDLNTSVSRSGYTNSLGLGSNRDPPLLIMNLAEDLNTIIHLSLGLSLSLSLFLTHLSFRQ